MSRTSIKWFPCKLYTMIPDGNRSAGPAKSLLSPPTPVIPISSLPHSPNQPDQIPVLSSFISSGPDAAESSTQWIRDELSRFERELRDEIQMLRDEVQMIRESISRIVEEKVAARTEQMGETWRAELQAMERRIRGSSPTSSLADQYLAHAFSASAELTEPTISSYRPHLTSSAAADSRKRSPQGTPTSHVERLRGGPSGSMEPVNITTPRKRPRLEASPPTAVRIVTENLLTADEPRTPSPPKVPDLTFKTPVLPRTPSPSRQGAIPDNSASPSVGSDFFANPPRFSGLSKNKSKAGPIGELPYPIFATTPRPSEPTSPTTDAPPSASRGRNAVPSMLTPGRHRNEPTTRAVSDAHKELSTITESDEPRIERNRASSSAPTPTYLGPELRSSSLSSPRLSPSPSLGDTVFPHSPHPHPPHSVARSGPLGRHRPSSSPARDYMDVALHGFPDTADSPSGQATPGHRTMLGTERYRDTRFGDVPVFQWGTPSVDLGPLTPSQAQRDG